MDLRVSPASIESFFPIHHHHITSPILDPRSHPMSPFGFESLKNMDVNAQDGVRIDVQRSKIDLSAVADATPLNHVDSVKIMGSIRKVAAF
jgi:hypothetical protein